MIAPDERKKRFQAAFKKKLIARQEEDQRPFPHQTYKLGEKVTAGEIRHLPGQAKDGVPVILFHSIGADILLTTDGISFKGSNNTSYSYEWDDLSFTASPTIAYDDFSFIARQNAQALVEKYRFLVSVLMTIGFIIVSSIIFNRQTADSGVIATAFFGVLFILSTAINGAVTFVIAYFLSGFVLRNFYFRFYPKKSNAIDIRLHNKNIILKPIEYAEDIIDCIKLCLEIHRAQKLKYGF